MLFLEKQHLTRHRGTIMVLSLIFIVIFSVLAVSMAGMSAANTQVASNQHKVNAALLAAQSGLECGKYIVKTITLQETGYNYVSDTEANTVWLNLCQYLQDTALDGQSVISPSRFTDTTGSGDQVVTHSINFGSADTSFVVRFHRYDADPRTVSISSIGADGEATRKVGMDMLVTKDSEVLNYAVASRGRMWLTGSTTIYGNVFSTWNRAEISPYNMTSDSTIYGTVNTVLTLDQIDAQSYQLETLNAENQPIDANGNPLGTNYEDRYYSSDDEVKAYHEGINYDQPYEDMPGMDISDYNTDMYNIGLTTIPSCPVSQRRVEYFPHAAGNYSLPRDSSSTSYTRHVYQDQTFMNALLPVNRHALFKNCTFEGELYVDCSKTSTSKSYTNNVRFENCTFNGTIITDVPQTLNWKNNCLYFTGEAAFNNQSGIEEATILAPHFNVNLGNTNPQQSDNNVLTGAIVGGIVDVRGNAQIYGTIISMCDTSQWSSGYVTNIGATLDDGGSETTELGDVGVIGITPQEDRMLPSGITTPIIIKPELSTYSEGV